MIFFVICVLIDFFSEEFERRAVRLDASKGRHGATARLLSTRYRDVHGYGLTRRVEYKQDARRHVRDEPLHSYQTYVHTLRSMFYTTHCSYRRVRVPYADLYVHTFSSLYEVN